MTITMVQLIVKGRRCCRGLRCLPGCFKCKGETFQRKTINHKIGIIIMGINMIMKGTATNDGLDHGGPGPPSSSRQVCNLFCGVSKKTSFPKNLVSKKMGLIMGDLAHPAAHVRFVLLRFV